jgi:hypothetical protein
LTALSASGLTTGYTYNGLGGRLSQFKNGVTALNAGLTIDLVLLFVPNCFVHGIFL